MIDINWLTLVLGTGLPMLVAFITAQEANAGLKAVALAVLSAAGGVLQELVSVGGVLGAVDWNASLANAVTVFLVAVGAHYGLLKPVGVTGSDGAIQSNVSKGLGQPVDY